MCPVCLTTLAVTVATTTGIGASVAAVAMRVIRSHVPRATPDTTGPARASPGPDARGSR
jgi:hypothetical protein